MKRSHFALCVSPCAALVTLLLLVSVAQAQTGGQPEQSAATGYDLSWWTVDGGGVVGAGAPGLYTLSGSIGQPDDGPAVANGDYVLVGGFWGGALAQYRVYLPLVLRNM
jgi:hypothetical protein